MNEKEIINLLSDLKHRIFPRPFERLAVSGESLVGVEIGVFKGDHAKSMLDCLDIKHLYLIDPYEFYDEYKEGPSYCGIDHGSLHLAREEAGQKLRPYADKISWIGKKSRQCLEDIPDDLDFVYIDGNHGETYVREDIASYFPKVRDGGVIGGHDFYNGFCREHDGVIQAVIRFSVLNDLSLQVELPDWWIRK